MKWRISPRCPELPYGPRREGPNCKKHAGRPGNLNNLTLTDGSTVQKWLIAATRLQRPESYYCELRSVLFGWRLLTHTPARLISNQSKELQFAIKVYTHRKSYTCISCTQKDVYFHHMFVHRHGPIGMKVLQNHFASTHQSKNHWARCDI